MSLSAENILQALSQVIDPDLKKDLVSLGMIRDLDVNGQQVNFTLVLTTPACPLKESIKKACIQAIHELVDNSAEVNITLTSRVTGKTSQDQQPLLSGVKNIIAVASGKGGVGKSTVAANLAVSLAANGARTALVDADIYGPSLPLMFDLENAELKTIEINGKALIEPMEKYGVKLLSIGFFIDASRALIWRGPMATGALKQLFSDARWGELDYMIIDLPPGTGDIHLTLVQSIKLSGVVIVTTPQEIALADARKAVSMFQNENINIPVLGIVENMSWFTPSELPQNKYFLFGKNGGVKMAEQLGVPFLGQIPLIQGVREAGDKGKPEVLDTNSLAFPYFKNIAQQTARQLSIINAMPANKK
jgi:ATP-binding protein involved in chromosome partitioning